MPRVKLDYVVSFSSEDSENQASNLLAHDVSKKKWLCETGEPSCSVVLQLTRAVQISTVHIGACHAALVEVLVGRSEKPNDPFEVLVPSSVFLSPMDSRKGTNVERVRSFSGDQLASAKDSRWDRVRVVCSQPYNKHCKYGLSFVHIFEPEDKASTESEPKLDTPKPVATAVPGRMMTFNNYSSDEDDFKPGELFAKHREQNSDKTSEPGTSGDTGAQIRQATSLALKNINDSSTKLVKTPIAKTNTNHQNIKKDFDTNRQKNSVMYTDDDDLPNDKIDSVVQRHKNDKEQQEIKKKEAPKRDKQQAKMDNSSAKFNDFIDIDVKDDKKKESHNKKKDTTGSDKPSSSRESRDFNNSRDDRRKDFNNSRSKDTFKDDKRSKDDKDRSRKKTDENDNNRDKDSRKRMHTDEKRKENEALRPGPVTSSPHTLMRSVVFALSGYENPRRARLRDAATAMGARFQRDWGPDCTHLICAFPNTPKLKSIRASSQNCIAVLGEWIEECCEKRRMLPWQWFATEPKNKVAPPATLRCDDEEKDDDKTASEYDTDDEIERVLRKQKKQRIDKSPSPQPQTSKDKSPKPDNDRQRPKPQTSRERSPRPHSSKERSRNRSRDRSPISHSSREKSPKGEINKEKSRKRHKSRDRSPRPHSSKENTPRSKKNSSDVNLSSSSDVAFVKDERVQASITIESGDETDEEKAPVKEKVDKRSVLPDFFEGYTFVIDEGVEEAGFDRDLLSRYVKAYGGVVMDASQVDSDSEVSYILSAKAGRKPANGQTVRADWVWRCHEDKRLCEVTEYVL